MTALPPLRRALGGLPRAPLPPATVASRPSRPPLPQSGAPAVAQPRAAYRLASSSNSSRPAAHAHAGRLATGHEAHADAGESSSRRRAVLRRASTSTSTRPLARHARCHSTESSSTPSSSHSADAAAQAPYDVFFCGTDDFAATVLARLLASPALYSSIAVLVPPAPRPARRAKRILVSRPVAELAAKHGLAVHIVPEGGLHEFSIPPTSAASLLLTASFGHLLPTSMLAHWPERQRLNVHPSLLPQLRGAAPIQWAIMRRQQTGVSIQELGEKFDTGRLLCQTPVASDPDADYTSLKAVLADASAELLVQTLENLPRLSAEAKPQSGPSSRAPKLLRSHSLVDWRASAEEIVAQHRAFSYLFPLHTVFRGTPVQLHGVSEFPASLELPELLRQDSTPAGTALLMEQGFVIKCGSAVGQEPQAVLVASLHTENKHRLPAIDWALKNKLGSLDYPEAALFGEAADAGADS